MCLYIESLDQQVLFGEYGLKSKNLDFFLIYWKGLENNNYSYGTRK